MEKFSIFVKNHENQCPPVVEGEAAARSMPERGLVMKNFRLKKAKEKKFPTTSFHLDT